MTKIHPLSSVHADAQIGENVEVGPFAVIEEGAVVGDGCVIGPNSYITKWARLGKDVKVSKGAVVGTDPQDLKFGNEKTTLEVGDRTVIREFVTLNRGTTHSYKTVVGSDCLLMAYVHVAHDCKVGNHVVLANSVNLAGHVTIGDWVGVGGLTGFHQFVNIGDHCFVGGMSKVRQDVPPFILAADDPLDYKGINVVGLKRRGFNLTQIKAMKEVYKFLYRSGLNQKTALGRVREEIEFTDEVKQIVDFIENGSGRGLIGKSSKTNDLF